MDNSSLLALMDYNKLEFDYKLVVEVAHYLFEEKSNFCFKFWLFGMGVLLLIIMLSNKSVFLFSLNILSFGFRLLSFLIFSYFLSLVSISLSISSSFSSLLLSFIILLLIILSFSSFSSIFSSFLSSFLSSFSFWELLM